MMREAITVRAPSPKARRGSNRMARTPRTQQRLQVLQKKLVVDGGDAPAAVDPTSRNSAFWKAIDELNQQECTGCGSTFSLVNRRHHCRDCLAACCNTCSRARRPVPGMEGLQRVCKGCENLEPPPEGIDLVTLIKQMSAAMGTPPADGDLTAPNSPAQPPALTGSRHAASYGFAMGAVPLTPSRMRAAEKAMLASAAEHEEGRSRTRSRAADAIDTAADAVLQAPAPDNDASVAAAIATLRSPRSQKHKMQVADLYAPGGVPETHIVEKEEFDALYRGAGDPSLLAKCSLCSAADTCKCEEERERRQGRPAAGGTWVALVMVAASVAVVAVPLACSLLQALSDMVDMGM